MRMTYKITIALVALSAAAQLPAQDPVAGGAPGTQGTFGGRVPNFPERPPGDPAAITRGRKLYGTNCSFCHGEDARGGAQGGPNLIRSDYLLHDQNGEVLATIVRKGLPGTAMAGFTLSSAEVSDLAAFIHSFLISSRDPGRMRPPSIVVGDAKAGETYFKSKCVSCHSVTGDLKGIASRIDDPRTLQQTWIMPLVYGGRGFGTVISGAINVPPVTVTVTQPDGRTVEGRLGRIDDFIVTLTEADGTARSFRRDGALPKVEVHDPMQPHKDLLRVYGDKDIHDVTAYLVTIK